jgi:hypothetical protein
MAKGITDKVHYKGKLEINPHLILFTQMSLQISLTPPLNLFQNLPN